MHSDWQRAENLKQLIGHNKGQKFRDFAQTMTLDVLVHYANHRLQGFAPRYELATRENLQLDVIDHDQADEKRPVNTLSGGESFLVSLALALALADFNRGSAHIGSLFIDEGFGSLDNSSLNTALAALEDVQNQLGAQIIVISHVGELDNRWRDHIHVKRIAKGRSWLQIPGGPQAPAPSEDLSNQLVDPELSKKIRELLSQTDKMTVAAIAKALNIDDRNGIKHVPRK